MKWVGENVAPAKEGGTAGTAYAGPRPFVRTAT